MHTKQKKEVNMKKSYLMIIMVTAMLFSTGAVMAGTVLDEQYGPGGAKVELVKAKVRNGVLTLGIRYIHPAEVMVLEEGKDRIDINPYLKSREIPIKFKVSDVFYLVNGKRYYVLKDKQGNWLASPVVGDYIAEPINKEILKKHLKKEKIPALILDGDHPIKILWFKFPAPPEGTEEIEFQVPEVSPFDVEIKK